MEKRKCKQCGKNFVISDSESDFFKSKGLELPKRCKECRKSNRGPAEESRPDAPGKAPLFVKLIVPLLFVIIAAVFGFDEFFGSKSEAPASQSAAALDTSRQSDSTLTFRNSDTLNDHYEKHGIEMGFSTAWEYEKAAAEVVSSPDAIYKTEKEDGDGVYYIEASNDFVIVSDDGYIRTYFHPDDGKAYFDRQ